MTVVASRSDMDNWVGLIYVSNVVSKGKSIDEDSNEELVDGGDEVVVEVGASQDKTRTIK